jgi:hypothetical protein
MPRPFHGRPAEQRKDWSEDAKIKLDEVCYLIRTVSESYRDDEMNLLADEWENLATDADTLLSRVMKLG